VAGDHVTVLRFSILVLLVELFSDRESSLMSFLLGSAYSKEKSFNDFLNNALFVFIGFDNFYMIKSIFGLYNIHISGGSGPSRFALSSVQSNLLSFLNLVGLLKPFNNKEVYESYVDLSTTRSFNALVKPKITHMANHFEKWGSPTSVAIAHNRVENEMNLFYYMSRINIYNYVSDELKQKVKDKTSLNNSLSEFLKSNEYFTKEIAIATDKIKLNNTNTAAISSSINRYKQNLEKIIIVLKNLIIE
jgi:hypothetical protein